MRAPWQLQCCPPPSLSPLIPSSLPASLPLHLEKNKVWCEKRKGGGGVTAGWMVGDGWNHGILARVPVCEVGGLWCHAATVCRTLVSSSVQPLTRLLCLAWLIYNDPRDKNINILMPNKIWFTYMTWMQRTHLWRWVKWRKRKRTAFNNILYILALHIFSFSY